MFYRLLTRMNLACCELIQRAFQLFQLLSSFTQLAFCRQALVVGQIFRSFCDEGVAVCGAMGFGG